jgi:hypothetical protein
MGSTVFPAAGGGVNKYAVAYTSTTTWTAPSTCNSVDVFLVGGGGGGGGISGTFANGYNVIGCGGGGGGGSVITATVPVTPGTTYTITIGAGGSGGVGAANATAGADTTFGSLATAYGGGAGGGCSFSGGTGQTFYVTNISRGTGGGQGYAINSFDTITGGPGGGALGTNYFFPLAQTNFALFTESNWFAQNASLYSGSGGGQAMNQGSVLYAGAGINGFGGGGSGAQFNNQSGTTNRTVVSSGGAIGPCNITSNSSANGNAGTTNKGGGGSGAIVRTSSNTLTATGGAGGSGYAYITYWS